MAQVLTLGYISFNIFLFIKKTQLSFVARDLINNNSAILNTLMINHNNATWQLIGLNLDNQKLLRDLLDVLQKFRFYRLQVFISQA